MDPWRSTERVTVRRVGNGYLAEARTNADWACGEVTASPECAMNSAIAALASKLGQRKQKPRAAKPSAPLDFEDLL